METVRINRYLAMCGLGSRRACENLVAEGRVSINGRPINQLGEKVRPSDKVLVDGEPVKPDRGMVVLLHKPRGIVCTRNDPQGRQTVYDLLPPELQSLAHVGRLDRESEGMLILTNDGHLAHRLTHPSSKVEKEYLVQIDRVFDPRDRQRMLDGIALEEGMAYATAVEALAPRQLKLILQQGIKRQIRLMLQALGYEVRQLVRTRIGSLVDTKLKAGKWRRLKPIEIDLLQNIKPAAKSTRTAAKSTRKSAARKSSKSPAPTSRAAAIPPPPIPTPKGRLPAVLAASQGKKRSPDGPVRGTVEFKTGKSTTRRTPAKKGKSTMRPAGKSAARQSAAKRPAPKRGSKRPR